MRAVCGVHAPYGVVGVTVASVIDPSPAHGALVIVEVLFARDV